MHVCPVCIKELLLTVRTCYSILYEMNYRLVELVDDGLGMGSIYIYIYIDSL